MDREISGLPGVTNEIFREFIERMMRYYVSEAREVIAKTFKDKNRFFTYEISDIGISFQAGVTDDGDCIIHWNSMRESGMKYVADALTFDDMMTTRVPPAVAFLQKRVKIHGPLGDAIRFLAVVPYLQKAYIKARGEIVREYGLGELACNYPVPEDYLERLG